MEDNVGRVTAHLLRAMQDARSDAAMTTRMQAIMLKKSGRRKEHQQSLQETMHNWGPEWFSSMPMVTPRLHLQLESGQIAPPSSLDFPALDFGFNVFTTGITVTCELYKEVSKAAVLMDQLSQQAAGLGGSSSLAADQVSVFLNQTKVRIPISRDQVLDMLRAWAGATHHYHGSLHPVHVNAKRFIVERWSQLSQLLGESASVYTLFQFCLEWYQLHRVYYDSVQTCPMGNLPVDPPKWEQYEELVRKYKFEPSRLMSVPRRFLTEFQVLQQGAPRTLLMDYGLLAPPAAPVRPPGGGNPGGRGGGAGAPAGGRGSAAPGRGDGGRGGRQLTTGPVRNGRRDLPNVHHDSQRAARLTASSVNMFRLPGLLEALDPPPRDDQGNEFCLKWHVVGHCYETWTDGELTGQCLRKDNHKILSATENETLDNALSQVL